MGGVKANSQKKGTKREEMIVKVQKQRVFKNEKGMKEGKKDLGGTKRSLNQI